VTVVAAGVIAKRKGRSAEKWLLATALLGPLAFLILLGSDSVLSSAPAPKLRVEVEITVRLCAHCRALIPPGEDACQCCAPVTA
jgi:hypothetical protein